jgi:hypothetical protein
MTRLMRGMGTEEQPETIVKTAVTPNKHRGILVPMGPDR